MEPTLENEDDIQAKKRRSSTRSIKRRKFDDELVESSLNLQTVQASVSKKITVPFATGGADEVPFVPPASSLSPSLNVANLLPDPRRKIGKVFRRPKRPRPSQASATKDLGRWKPSDDLALITAVQQTGDLVSVHRGVKFSCFFTLTELTERWYALLYDKHVSRLAQSALRNLQPAAATNCVNNGALYSKAEEALLYTLPSNSMPTLETFEKLLQGNPSVFHPCRTAQRLQMHWQSLKQFHLLPDQTLPPWPRQDHVLSFSDADEMLNELDYTTAESKDEALDAEMSFMDRLCKREIRLLESELGRWQVLVEAVTGISPPDFDSQTLAVLRGRLVRYLMRSREVTLGRSTAVGTVDIDLALEGPAWKVSRRQGIIKLRASGEFLLLNEGKRPIYVDGNPVLTNQRTKLAHNGVVEIAGLKFVFLINQELISAIRTEAARLNASH